MTPLSNRPDLRPPGSHTLGLLRPRPPLLLAAVAVIALFIVWLGCSARKHSPLNRFKAELRARGEKLSFQELARAESPDSERWRTQFVSLASGLGQHRLSPGAMELMVYVLPGTAQVAWKQESPPWIPNAGPGTAGTWEQFNSEIGQAGEILAIVRQSLTNPAASWSSPGSFAKGAIPSFMPLRLSAQWLSGEAISNLREGRLEEALQDIEAIATCAQIDRENCLLVTQMLRVAVTGLGLSVTWEALQAPGWTEAQLERLHKAWEPVALIDAVETGLIGVRADCEETWGRAHRTNGRQLRLALTFGQTNVTAACLFTDFVQFPVYRLAWIDDDELFYLRCMQDSLDRVRAIKKGQPWVEMQDGLSAGALRVGNLNFWSGGFRHWVSIRAMPNFVRATTTAARNETLRQLALTAIAIKRYHLQNGFLPVNLAQLRPRFLSQPTYDPMSGQQLHYVVRDDGRFILYSTGQDGRDDGGEPKFVLMRKFGLWEDADAVWPQAGQPLLGAR
jgi:hypothetical protein